MIPPDDDIVTAIDEKDEKINRLLVEGAAKGVLAAGAMGAGLWGLQRCTTILKGFSPSAKMATILCTGLGATAVSVENAVYRVRRPMQLRLRGIELEDETFAEKLYRYRTPLVGGGLVTAVTAGMLLSAHDPFRSGTQKFLNARLYGQLLGLGLLFGSISVASAARSHMQAQRRLEQEEADRRLYEPVDDKELLLPELSK